MKERDALGDRRERREELREMNKGFVKPRKRTSLWLIFGVGILIILLLLWLTIADFWGDTDVAACISWM